MKRAVLDEEIVACYPVLKELRPNLIKGELLHLTRTMEQEGYELHYLEVDGRVVSVAGIRVCYNFAAEGNALYIYDLVTDSNLRSAGHASILLRDIETYSLERGCSVVHLDSGVERYRAHKFYLKNNYFIKAHHFLKRMV